MSKRIVVFTGAGVSAESGLGTFRDSDGLWEHYRIEDVCTHEAWLRNPQLCVDFYNARRKDTLAAQPNAAHVAIAKLQAAIPGTRIITQNIDDLHERAGAKDVVHLHGEITKLRSENNETATVPLKGWEQHYGDRHPDGKNSIHQQKHTKYIIFLMSKRIVVFTGAGVSAESGLGTFRDSDGLWEHYRIEDVCTHEAWLRNPQLCVDFYNARRKDTLAAQPNAAHVAIAKLQAAIPGTRIITQNIDDLHERAGAKDVVHLHGEITKLRSENNETATVPLKGWEQHYGDRHPDGSLLRPYIVFFGEGVPYFEEACKIASEADIMVVVGTSLNVYPAASLIHYAPAHCPIYFVDPGQPEFGMWADRITHIQKKATEGVPELVEKLIEDW